MAARWWALVQLLIASYFLACAVTFDPPFRSVAAGAALLYTGFAYAFFWKREG